MLLWVRINCHYYLLSLHVAVFLALGVDFADLLALKVENVISPT